MYGSYFMELTVKIQKEELQVQTNYGNHGNIQKYISIYTNLKKEKNKYLIDPTEPTFVFSHLLVIYVIVIGYLLREILRR